MLDIELVPCHDIQRACQLFARDGFVALSGTLDSQQLSFAQAGAQRIVAQQQRATPFEMANRGYARYSFGQQIHHPEWAMLVDLPTVLPVRDALWGSQDYMCSGAGGDYSHPGANIQHLHSDVNDVIADPQGQVNIYDLPAPFIVVNYLMTDFTVQNGAIRFVPGTQRTRVRPPALEDEPEHWKTATVCAPAGTAIVRDVRTWHGGTANSAQAPRIMTSAGYFAPWFRRDGSDDALPVERYNALSERGKALCRYIVNWREALEETR